MRVSSEAPVKQGPRLFRAAVITIGLLATVLVGVADEITGDEVIFTLLYLGPIAFVAWWAGRRPALLVAVLSALDWLVADLLNRPAYVRPVTRYWNLVVEGGVFLVFALTVAALRSHMDNERSLARTDPLTGLANRRAFLASLGLGLESARRHGRPFTMAYVDVDGFKAVNDRLGHAGGDALLVATSATLLASLRTVDVVARLGGDEFALFLPETEAAAARALLQRLQEGLRATGGRHGWPVTFSIGAITFDTPPAAVDEMIRSADRAMYEAKRAGKDRLNHEVAESAAAREPVP